MFTSPVIYCRHEECYQCYDFHPRHANILQYRKSPCEALPETQEEFYADEEQYCREKIPKESKLHTLIKLKTFNINCPFEGDFVFTYKEGKEQIYSDLDKRLLGVFFLFSENGL